MTRRIPDNALAQKLSEAVAVNNPVILLDIVKTENPRDFHAEYYKLVRILVAYKKRHRSDDVPAVFLSALGQLDSSARGVNVKIIASNFARFYQVHKKFPEVEAGSFFMDPEELYDRYRYFRGREPQVLSAADCAKRMEFVAHAVAMVDEKTGSRHDKARKVAFNKALYALYAKQNDNPEKLRNAARSLGVKDPALMTGDNPIDITSALWRTIERIYTAELEHLEGNTGFITSQRGFLAQFEWLGKKRGGTDVEKAELFVKSAEKAAEEDAKKPARSHNSFNAVIWRKVQFELAKKQYEEVAPFTANKQLLAENLFRLAEMLNKEAKSEAEKVRDFSGLDFSGVDFTKPVFTKPMSGGISMPFASNDNLRGCNFRGAVFPSVKVGAPLVRKFFVQLKHADVMHADCRLQIPFKLNGPVLVSASVQHHAFMHRVHQHYEKMQSAFNFRGKKVLDTLRNYEMLRDYAEKNPTKDEARAFRQVQYDVLKAHFLKEQGVLSSGDSAAAVSKDALTLEDVLLLKHVARYDKDRLAVHQRLRYAQTPFDLSGLKLSGDLTGIDLTGAILSDCKFAENTKISKEQMVLFLKAGVVDFRGVVVKCVKDVRLTHENIEGFLKDTISPSLNSHSAIFKSIHLLDARDEKGLTLKARVKDCFAEQVQPGSTILVANTATFVRDAAAGVAAGSVSSREPAGEFILPQRVAKR